MSKIRQLSAVALVIGATISVVATTAGGAGIALESNHPADGADQNETLGGLTSEKFDTVDSLWTNPDRALVQPREFVRAVETIDPPRPAILIPPAGYSRYDDTDPLENSVRRSVYDTIVSSPGTYLSQIADEVDCSLSTVRYHVRILVHERQLQTEKIDGKRRVFPLSVTDHEAYASLNDERPRDLLESIRRLEPTTVSMLSVEIDRSPSTVSYHLSRLESADLISRERDGASVSVRLTKKAQRGLERLEAAS